MHRCQIAWPVGQKVTRQWALLWRVAVRAPVVGVDMFKHTVTPSLSEGDALAFSPASVFFAGF